MRVPLTALLLSSTLLSAQIMAHDHTLADLHIQHPWSRALPPVAPTGAAYMVIENRGNTADTLKGASTPIAGYTELHEHVHQDDLMKMQRVDNVIIAPGEQVEFAPGGYHVMLFELKEPLVAGNSYPMTLTFEHAGEIAVEVQVSKDEARGADAQHSEHDHSHHH